jgi:hypothetical protein
VQRRRELPTRVVQRVQILIQDNVIAPTLRGDATPRAPRIVRLIDQLPVLRRIPARLVGLGFRRERVSEQVLRR